MNDRIFKARAKFQQQKKSAKRRGIEWQLTFREWLEWWGDDLELRGTGRDNLQMLRFMDQGPYALWNIKKGKPADNAKTAGNMQRNRTQERLKAEREARLDAAMWANSKEPTDKVTAEEWELRKRGVMPSTVLRYRFALDKKLW